MDLPSLTSNPAPRLLPHLSAPINHHHHGQHHHKPAGDGEGDFAASRCSNSSLSISSRKSSSNSKKMGVDGGSEGGQERPTGTLSHNGDVDGQVERYGLMGGVYLRQQ